MCCFLPLFELAVVAAHAAGVVSIPGLQQVSEALVKSTARKNKQHKKSSTKEHNRNQDDGGQHQREASEY